MAVTTEEILAAARELAGRAMTDGEEKILSVLCAGELGAWRGRLREGVTEEDCGDALTVACAWGALAAMETAWEQGSGRVVSFSAGDLSVRETEGQTAEESANALRRQAERLMAPYLADGFAFRGVLG